MMIGYLCPTILNLLLVAYYYQALVMNKNAIKEATWANILVLSTCQ